MRGDLTNRQHEFRNAKQIPIPRILQNMHTLRFMIRRTVGPSDSSAQVLTDFSDFRDFYFFFLSKLFIITVYWELFWYTHEFKMAFPEVYTSISHTYMSNWVCSTLHAIVSVGKCLSIQHYSTRNYSLNWFRMHRLSACQCEREFHKNRSKIVIKISNDFSRVINYSRSSILWMSTTAHTRVRLLFA